MDFATLKSTLKIADGKLTIGPGILTPNIDTLIHDIFDGTPMILADAAPLGGNVAANEVAFTGKSSLLNVENVPTSALFSVDEGGHAQVLLRYTLIEDHATGDGWKFSKSFPSLPGVIDWSKKMLDQPIIPLDGLSLSNASFVVSSRIGEDPIAKIGLEPGINFVSDMKIEGFVGQIESLIDSSHSLKSRSLKLYGPIRFPATDDPVQALEAVQFPWAVKDRVPGIQLQASLGHDAQFEKMVFGGLVFRIYSPTSQEWLDANPSYTPVLAYTGHLSVPNKLPGKKLDLDVVAEIAIGATDLLIAGNFKGVSIADLDDLVGIVGPGPLIASMPDTIKTASNRLNSLELKHASVGLDLNHSTKKMDVTSASVTVGMREGEWPIFEEPHFSVASIVSSFSVTSPFAPDKRKIEVDVSGCVKIENVPININTSSAEQFTVFTELADNLTIPLESLMGKYMPGVKPPSNLTINRLAASIAPGKQYSMAVTMASEPNPWEIPLGPKTLTVSDVSMNFLSPKGGSLTGQFSGTIALGTVASMSMSYSVPGLLVLEARLPHISLSNLAREVANVTALPLPQNFPEIELIDSSVRMTRTKDEREAIYDFLLRTTVSVGGTTKLNLRALVTKSSEGFGFAVGIKWETGEGWSPGSLWEPLKVLEINNAGLVISTLDTDNAAKGELIPGNVVPALEQDKFKLVSGVTFFATLSLKTGEIAILSNIFGPSATFYLYASYQTETKATTLIAHMASGDKSKKAFAFSDVGLIWKSVGTSSFSISLKASGHLSIGASQQLDYSVSGSIETAGSARLKLEVCDWIHPFGYGRLIIKEFGISISLGGGVTITLQGTFQFTTKRNKKFQFAVAGAITNFEIPSALAFHLKPTEQGTTLKFGEVLEGISTIDIYDLPPTANALPWIGAIKLLDLFLEIGELDFWAVTVDQVEIGGVTYKKGFGLRGALKVFGINVSLYLELQEEKKFFVGSAEFPDELKLGEVLRLSRPSEIKFSSKSDLAKSGASALPPGGPVLAVSSQIDETHKHYLYVAAHLQLFDIFRADILGKATNDGVVYDLDLSIGKAGQGAWLEQRTTLTVSREQLAFKLGLAYQFGLVGAKLGGFKLFGTLPIPQVELPNLKIDVRGDVSAELKSLKVGLRGSLAFEFMNHSFTTSDLVVAVDLSKAPQRLAEFGTLIFDWIKQNIEKIMQAVFDTAQKFADWVKKNFEQFKDLVAQVAQVLKDAFNQTEVLVVETLLTGIGWAQDLAAEAVQTAFNVAAKACSMTTALSYL